MSTNHPVHRVTDAPTTQIDDMKPRMLKYGISMGFRIVFFPVAVFFLDGWMRIVGLIIVLLLPWIAVVIANAGRETTPHSEDLIDGPPRPVIGDGADFGDSHRSTVVQGEVVNDAEPPAGHGTGRQKGRSTGGTGHR